DESGIAYALYEPDSGFADPVATTNAYVEAGRRAGGVARDGTPVEGIEVDGGKVRGVRVGGELLECDALVLAAGPWSGKLAAGAGVELPLELTREQDVVFETAPEATIPCAVSSQIDRVYLRPDGDARVLVIRGGTILDGTGGEPFTGDVAIDGDRIAAVGAVPPTDGLELDATGLDVAPGFVDLHSHSDYTLLVDPRAASAIHQGVTLEVVGNCGFGCFPIRDAELARKAIYGYSPDVPIDWTSAGGYFERLQAAKPAVNVVSLVPNGQLRLATIGLADRAADTRELEEMKALLRESLGEGAWGYSTGLEYAQEAGAPEREVAALAAAMSPSGGLYATHTRRRDEG